ncbi:hypothetical protein C8J57DRAFT_1705333 [Mycena rebaudengoi]|nr:hypothetical protein C8J57DRAFT_1705333 [Mycena rebaudengoi]
MSYKVHPRGGYPVSPFGILDHCISSPYPHLALLSKYSTLSNMPAISTASTASTLFSESLNIRYLFIIPGAGFVILLLSYLFSTGKLWNRTKSADVEIASAIQIPLSPPVAAYLRPDGSDMSIPELPFAPRPPPSLKTLPKARTPSSVYRYPGNCWNQEHLSIQSYFGPQPPQPSPVWNVATLPALRVAEKTQAVKYQTPEVLLHKQLLKYADDVLGVYPGVLALKARPVPECPQASFPSPVTADNYKCGLVHTLDVRPEPIPPIAIVAPRPEKPLVEWGTESYTLALPLRGNKLARKPYVWCPKAKVTTNVVFSKTSPFHAASLANKENCPV